MTKVTFHRGLPVIDRDSFLTPFDKMFDDIIGKSFPEINQQVGVNPFQGTAYPKVNVYEYEKHNGIFDEAKAKVLRRELKHSSFKRQFTLGDLLDGENISANFKDGILSVEIPKVEPELPKKTLVKIK